MPNDMVRFWAGKWGAHVLSELLPSQTPLRILDVGGAAGTLLEVLAQGQQPMSLYHGSHRLSTQSS